MNTTNNTNIITQTRDIDKLTDLYFNEKYILYIHHINSFNQFMNDVVKNEVERAVHILGEYEIYNEDKKEKKLYRYSFEFKNICIKPPVDENSSYEDEYLLPEEARKRSLSYSGKILADIIQYQEILIYGPNGLEENTKKVIASETRILIGKIPIMLRSAYCTTTIKKDTPNKECIYDPGCYFLIRGNEKVILSLEKICDNKMLVFTKKDINYQDKLMYTCQVNSKNNNYYNNGSYSNNLQILSIKMKKDKSIVLNMVQFSEIPIFIFFRALGIETDKDIIQYILHDDNDIELLSLLEISQTAAINETIKNEKNKIEKTILTTEDATQYLISKIKSKRIFDNIGAESRIAQKRELLMTLLCRDFLPHMGLTEDKIIPKAYYLGKMVNKLLRCFLGKIPIDDRDSFVNKRIQLPGELLSDLYRRYFKKMLNECARHFKQRINGNHDNPINVINIIKSTTIEQGFNKALSIGLFGNKPGVAQALQRLSYKQTMSYFRRLMPPPSNEATTSKITTMRFPNNIQYGFIDLIETPEGANVGLQKHLALMASVSMNLDITQIDIIKNIIINAKYKDNNENISYLQSLIDVIKIDIKLLTHININGEWLGLTEKPIELIKLLKDKREKGEINKMASINFSFSNNTIDIYTDGGRLIRPLLKVDNNKLLLNKTMLDDIDIKAINRTKITRWAEFLQKYPNVIEYVDVEESENIMVSMKPNDIIDNYNRMTTIIDKPNKIGDPSNRYNDTIYVKYTHCEFHPMMMMGAISATVPFAEHNQAPRNYYSYSQSRQGMGIYLSSYRHRIDLSTILYHPQRPLVTSKAGYYTNSMDLPSGQNLIVAIMCYTGYNQEDSVIVNKSFIDRGGFRSTSLKGYSDTVNKNTSTGQDEKFMKPNDNIAIGIKEADYSKLNDQGFVPEETIIYNNDVIIGKCAPIQPTNSNKLFKDESQTYKSNVPGVVDKVYTGILNGDGYETYNLRIRSQRIMDVGDKMASCMGQKGTAGILLPQQDMPFTKDGIRPDIIINPCCFVGNTLVSLTNGLSKRIDSFSAQGLEKVYTFNDKGLINSYSLGMESRGIKETIKLTLFDGRELICTPDHKFKVKVNNEYIYKEAKDLINTDNLVSNIEYTEDINYNDEDKWCLTIGYYKFNMLNEENRNKSLALGRILGYIFSENKCMDTLLDINNLIYDIYLVTGIQTNILYNNDKFYTNIPVDLLYDIYKLDNENNIPDLILSHDTPKSFIREYIATYLSYNKINDFTKQIVLKLTNIYDDINYLKYIGYRYNINKSLDLSLHVSYLKYCKYNNVIIEKNTYLKLINADNLLISKDMNYIPCWLNKVNLIEQNGVAEVFDIGVATHNNFCVDGIVVSNCIPSRMTIAQLIESIFAKVGALRGETMDGTPFSNIDIDSVSKMLKDYGFDENGYEEMYCGMTGKKLHSKIFIAPTHYMRLKHMVQDKIHCLTPDHEVLTKLGWKLITDLTNEDLIATLTKDKLIEYHKPNKIYKYEDYNGEMYEIKNDSIELNVTINHRMLLNNNNELELVKASELINDKVNIYLDGNKNNILVNDYDTRVYNYNGVVMCLEVPNETFLVRKNNKTVWTGNSRAGTGPRQKLTRQPPEGRAKNGGHRFGEMERDAMIAHGCALFLKERMVDTSDIYITFVCNKCGLLAIKLSDKDVWKCNQCNDNPEVSKIAIPYAFKLLVQELMAINILPRIKVEQDI